MSFDNQARSARASASPPLNQVALVCIHAAHNDFVSQDRIRRYVRGDVIAGAAASSDAGQAHNASGAELLNAIVDDRSNSGAFDNDVRFESDPCDVPAVVSSPERSHQPRLSSRLDTV